MKLHELDAQRLQEQVARVFETHLGHRIDFQRLTADQAQRMLHRVRDLVREHRASPSRHFGERNPDYLKLVMMEQALAQHVKEMDGAMGAVMRDPKAKAVMDKVTRGQTLTPDEQQTVNRIALAKEDQVTEKYQGFEKTVKAIKKGGSARDPEAVAAAIGRKKYGKERFQKAAAAGRKLGESLRLTESEIQTAQVVLAAQDMVDRIQGMMEDISEMQFKDLPALVNSIRNDMGAEQATQFQAQASTALSTLLTAVQAGKTEMESAQGVLTGQAPVVPGQDAGMAIGTPDTTEPDLSLDANLPAPGEEEEEEEEVSVGLGRERR
jgi:hypothetical protein